MGGCSKIRLDISLRIECHYSRQARTHDLLIWCFLLKLTQTEQLGCSSLSPASMGQTHQSQHTLGKSSTSTRLIKRKNSAQKMWGCQCECVAVTTRCLKFSSLSHKLSQQNHCTYSLSPKGESLQTLPAWAKGNNTE